MFTFFRGSATMPEVSGAADRFTLSLREARVYTHLGKNRRLGRGGRSKRAAIRANIISNLLLDGLKPPGQCVVR